MSYSYAQDTSVSVEKSRAEIENILGRYGATRFGYMMDDSSAVIVFEIAGKAVKFTLPIPSKSAFATKIRYDKKVTVTPDEQHRNWEQACRSRWRSLTLSIKAKLECVAAGISTVEIEFLAYFIVKNGKTVGDHVVPQLETMKQTGRLSLQLGSGAHDI